MDTRSKIVTPEALAALGVNGPTVAVGYFDVLRAGHVVELEALAGAGPAGLDHLVPDAVSVPLSISVLLMVVLGGSGGGWITWWQRKIPIHPSCSTGCGLPAWRTWKRRTCAAAMS